MAKIKLTTYPVMGELYVGVMYPEEVIAACECVLTGIVKADSNFYKEIFLQKARERLIDALVDAGTEKDQAIRIISDGSWAQRYVNAVENNESIIECLNHLDELLVEEIKKEGNV